MGGRERVETESCYKRCPTVTGRDECKSEYMTLCVFKWIYSRTVTLVRAMAPISMEMT